MHSSRYEEKNVEIASARHRAQAAEKEIFVGTRELYRQELDHLHATMVYDLQLDLLQTLNQEIQTPTIQDPNQIDNFNANYQVRLTQLSATCVQAYQDQCTMREYDDDGETELTGALRQAKITQFQEYLTDKLNNHYRQFSLTLETNIGQEIERIQTLKSEAQLKFETVLQQKTDLVTDKQNSIYDSGRREQQLQAHQVQAEETNYRCRPFFMACLLGNMEEVKEFVKAQKRSQKKNFISQLNGEGRSVLHYLAMLPKQSEMLSQDESLFHPIGFERLPVYRQQHNAVVDYLLARGIDGRQLDPDGYTPLHLACRYGNDHLVSALLETPARGDINLCAYQNRTPLHMAAHNGRPYITSLLLKAGALVDRPAEHGNTPLHEAVLKRHLDVARCLLGAGADAGALNEAGWSPLAIAVDCNHPQLVRELLSRNLRIPLAGKGSLSALLAIAKARGFTEVAARLTMGLSAQGHQPASVTPEVSATTTTTQVANQGSDVLMLQQQLQQETAARIALEGVVSRLQDKLVQLERQMQALVSKQDQTETSAVNMMTYSGTVLATLARDATTASAADSSENEMKL